MGIKLVSSLGGSVELVPPTTATSYTATMPAGTGTVAVQGASTNIVSGTAVASTSGTAIDFTSIPSWVKRITVLFNAVSTSGSSNLLIQLGAGSITSSGYTGAGSILSSVVTTSNFTTGFGIPNTTNTAILQGGLSICLIGSNIWDTFGTISRSDAAVTFVTAGNITLSGTLDRVRITTVNGTDTFDAGSINILYE